MTAPFLAACRREPTAYTPVWLMRQAGRYMPEYRAVRERMGFLELCKTPDAAAEVTVMAVEQLGVDAAIIFADILLVLEPLGVGLEFAKGDGPVIHRPVRTRADVDGLAEVGPGGARLRLRGGPHARVRRCRPESRSSASRARRSRSRRTSSRAAARDDWATTKRFMYADPGAWHALMERLVRVVAGLPERADRGRRAGGAALRQLGRLPRARPTTARTSCRTCRR